MELADQQNTEIQESPSGVASGSGAEVDSRIAPEKPDKPLSLREQIVKNVETIRTEEAKRARAADGKFTKLEEGAAEKPATPKTNPEPEANAQPAASKPVGPPSGWSKEAKAIWDQLPEAVKADAVRREAEVSKGFDEYRTKTAQLTEISQVLDPLRPMLQQHGITSDAQAVKRLIEWEGSFRNPATRLQAFQQLAQTYGVDLSTLVPSSQSGSPSAAQDIPDTLKPVLDQFGNVLQRVNSLEQNTINAQFAAFAKDHPHFETVRGTMGQLMQAGLAQDLEGAYQKAILHHPEISAQIKAEADRKSAEETERQAQEAERLKAEKARQAAQAAVSPSGRPPIGQPSASNASPPKGAKVRESILASVRQLREEQRA